ncbi:5-formyltetrahydrofolate cyclo-ligase [Paracoccaceae bacterium GXU_MW_L88]
MQSVDDDPKAALRREIRQRRDTAERAALSAALNTRLAGFLADAAEDAIIAGYWPIGSEADIRPALEDLSARHKVALPVVTAKAAPLTFRLWTPQTPMTEGRYGVQIPEQGDPVSPDVILAPLLAFDKNGTRLGYGGGYYDRSFAAHPAARRLGVGFAFQQVPLVPAEAHDIHLETIITEERVIQI